jgi:hypothetical protein
MRFKDRDDKKGKEEFETTMRVRYVDEYDQDLMELKKLVNMKQKTSDRIPDWEEDITEQMFEVNTSGLRAGIPLSHVKQDIDDAFEHGGKYRRLLKDRVSDTTLNIDRKKKSSKPKPKRKVKKVIKKCKCK